MLIIVHCGYLRLKIHILFLTIFSRLCSMNISLFYRKLLKLFKNNLLSICFWTETPYLVIVLFSLQQNPKFYHGLKVAKITCRFFLANQVKWHFKNTEHDFSIDKIIHFGTQHDNTTLDVKNKCIKL